MMPWWAGLLLFIGGILIGVMIAVLNELDEKPDHKYIKKG